MAIADAAGLRVGCVVQVSASALGESSPSLLLHGEVTALEGVYREGKAPLLVARGYDHAHRLTRGRTSATFQNVKYSDVARTIAGQVGLEAGTIDDSGSVHPHLGQAGQTDWEFLNAARARGRVRGGRRGGQARLPSPGRGVRGAGRRRPGLHRSAPARLRPGPPRVPPTGHVERPGLQRGGPRLGSRRQAADHRDRPGRHDRRPAGGRSGEPRRRLRRPGARRWRAPTRTQASADRAAAALAEKVGSAFAEASGIARGNPRLKAGAAVSISQVAASFRGRYTLTHTRHTYDPRDGYRTHFVVSGRQDRSLMGLIAGAAAAGASGGSGGRGGGGGGGGSGSAAKGVALAIVTSIDDPEKLGRVKIKLPVAVLGLREPLGAGRGARQRVRAGHGLDPRGERRGAGRLRGRRSAAPLHPRRPLERRRCAAARRAGRRRAPGPSARQPRRATSSTCGTRAATRHSGSGRARTRSPSTSAPATAR